MRYVFLLLMLAALALGLACQTASTSTETKNENPADTSATEKPADKEKAEKSEENAEKSEEKAESHNADDGHEHGDEAPRISLADAKKSFDAGEAVFIDTRSESAYATEHVKGAVNISTSDFESKYKDVPKDKKLIIYCS